MKIPPTIHGSAATAAERIGGNRNRKTPYAPRK
jgi:hypothetical protein